MKYLLCLLLFVLSSCAIGYKKLTTEKLEKKLNRNKIELIRFHDLPIVVSDTLAKEYEKYHNENKGYDKAQYFVSHFITFDSTVTGKHIKYQDFYSDKFRLPFGYFFKFGKEKFFIPYGEKQISQPYVFYCGYLYFFGKYLGEPKEPIYKIDHPDYYKINYEESGYWKIKL